MQDGSVLASGCGSKRCISARCRATRRACVAACPNGAANLFTGAKITHLNLLPQGQAERYKRTEAMVDELERFLGVGAYGEVWVAVQKNTGRRVAIKLLSP